MAESSALLTAANASQAINSAGQAYVQSRALRAKAEYENRIAEMNAKTLEAQAADAVARGEREALKKDQETRLALGSQRVAIAAGGGSLTEGSVAELQDETMRIGQADVDKIRANAYREAFGYKSAAEETRFQGRSTRNALRFQAKQTLISGGMDSLSSGVKAYGEYKRGKEPKKTSVGDTNASS